MGLMQAIFGAKPPYGTPPFAPPHVNTGGSEVPTTPDNMSRPHGLAGFVDRLAYPDNALGQIGMALLAGGGGTLGNAAQYLMYSGMQRRKNSTPQIEHVGDSIGVLDPRTGKYTPTYTAPRDRQPHYWESNDGSLHMIGGDGKPTEVYHDPTPKMNFIPDGMGGGNWVAVPTLPSGTPPSAPVGAITPIDDPSPASAPPAGGTRSGSLAPRGMRNNNYLNLTISPFTRSQAGFAGTDAGGRYATFDTPQNGLAAGRNLLGSYISRGFNTPAKIVSRWAPSSENGRSTQAYIDFVTQRLGIGPNDPVPAERLGDLMAAMSDFENGRHGTIGVAR